MEETKTCPKCNNEMEEGSFPQNFITSYISKKDIKPIQLTTKKQQPIVVYKCKQCGYLEMYTLNTQQR